ncbi:MAG: TIGR04076 family protein [Clostridia bacterium]|nr:TIGR04076 family protein [Clostridia bacterium]
MKQIRITALARHTYPELMEQYENPIEHACDAELGRVWLSVDGEKPEGFCSAAWRVLAPYVKTLAEGGGNFYDGWMKNPYSAMLSCDDGFRPVTYYVEAIEE